MPPCQAGLRVTLANLLGLLLGFALLAFRFAQVLWRLVKGTEAHLLGDEAAAILESVDIPADDAGKRAP